MQLDTKEHGCKRAHPRRLEAVLCERPAAERMTIDGRPGQMTAKVADGRRTPWGALSSARTRPTISVVLGATRMLLVTALASVLLATFGFAADASAAGSGPPVNTVAPSIGGTPKEAVTLKAKQGTWTGETPIKYEFKWERLESSTWTPIKEATGKEATGASYTLTAEDVGKRVRFTVTAVNNAGSTEAKSPESEAVAGVPPKNTTLPAITPTEPQEGEVLTASAGKWSGTPATKYTYLWEACVGKKCTVVSEEKTASESSSYRVASFLKLLGDPLRVTVTDENGFPPNKSATSAESAPVKPGPPVPEELPTIEGEAREGHTLTVNRGKWAGTPVIEFSYQWSGCTSLGGCMPIVGATGTTHQVEAIEVGEMLEVTVTARNGQGSTPASAETATVLGNAPKNAAPPVITGEAVEGTVLSASTGAWTGTPKITYSYAWEDCNAEGTSCAPIAGAANEASYEPHASDIGDTIRVTVTARNAWEPPASAASSPTAVVVGNEPRNTAAPSIAGKALEGETLSVELGTWIGKHPITFSYRWERCSAPGACAPTGATGSTYPLTHADVGSAIRLIVTGENNAGSTAAPATSETASVQGNGVAVGWGENLRGALGVQYRDSWETSPVPSGGVSGIAELAAGGSDTYARLDSGEIVAWGGNDGGENGDDEVLSAWEQGLTHVTVDELKNENEITKLTGVKQMASANEHALALMNNGTVETWGANGYGQLGVGVQGFEVQTQVNTHVARTVRWPIGSKTPEVLGRPKPGESEEEARITAVAGGGGSDYALTKKGTVWAWGDDLEGQLGVDFAPRKELVKGVETEVTGPEHCHTETTHGEQFEACGEFPRKVMWKNPETEVEEELSHVKAIAAGSYATYALLEDGEVVGWGSNGYGQLAGPHPTIHAKNIRPSYIERYTPGESHASERLKGVVEVTAGLNSTLVRLENGEILGFGNAEFGALTLPTPSGEEFKTIDREENCHNVITLKEEEEKVTKEEASIKKVEGELAEAKAKGETSVVTKLEAKLATLEKKFHLNPEPKFCVKRAIPLPALNSLGPEHLHAEQVSAGNHYGVALAHGKVFAWGSNERAQLGNGIEPAGEETEAGKVNEPGFPTPAEVRGFGAAVQATAGTDSAVAVLLAAGQQAPRPVLTGTPEPLAIRLEWEPETANGAEKVQPLRVIYKPSQRKGEPPVAEEGGTGEGGEGPPENIVRPGIELESEPLEETPVLGEQLKGTPGTWTGTHPKFTYQWLRCPTGEGKEPCAKIYRCRVDKEVNGVVVKEHLEITEEEGLSQCTEKESPSSFPGHKVQPGDVGHELEFEVIATNAEGTVTAQSSLTGAVVAEAGEAEGEKASEFSCKTEPKPPICFSPFVITETVEHEIVNHKQITKQAKLVAEPYEIHFTFPAPERERTKLRTLVVLPIGPPAITSQPVNATVKAGEEAKFHALASGGPRPTVRWESSTNGGASWSVVPGANMTSLVISRTTLAENGSEYRAVFTNSLASAETAVATLTVE
jgi:alpha-tubulin suppressor-like RCC1 family protein